MSVRAAVVQMCSGLDVGRNLADARRLLREAADREAVLVVLPENFAFMGRREDDRLAVAEPPGEGPLQTFLADQARELNLWIVGGTIPVAEPGEARPRASSLLYGPSGRLAARYDKIHLFDVGIPGRQEGYRESAGTTPGEAVVVADSPAGRLGMAVCYDLRFPELFRAMAQGGLDAVSVPAAFTVPTGEAHWEVLVRARAVENLCPVLAAAQGGLHEGGRSTWGHSMIVNHWGEVVAELPEGPGVLVAELDPEAQTRDRARFPALAHRRVTGRQVTKTEDDE